MIASMTMSMKKTVTTRYDCRPLARLFLSNRGNDMKLMLRLPTLR